MAKRKHLHKYEKVILGKSGYTVFRCIEPDCSHYIAKEFVKGKLCACNRCDNPMIMDTRAMNLTKPHCVDCIEHKDTNISKLKELMEKLG